MQLEKIRVGVYMPPQLHEAVYADWLERKRDNRNLKLSDVIVEVLQEAYADIIAEAQKNPSR